MHHDDERRRCRVPFKVDRCELQTATRLANAECERMEFRGYHQKRNRRVFEALLLRVVFTLSA